MLTISTNASYKVGPQPESTCGGGNGHFSKWPPYKFSKPRIYLTMGGRNLILVSIPMFSSPMISNMASVLMYQALVNKFLYDHCFRLNIGIYSING